MVPVLFWFDPLCPWTWLTSRWMLEVEKVRDVRVRFRVMSLAVLNEASLPSDPKTFAEYWGPVRMMVATDVSYGPDAVRHLYSALGDLIHRERLSINRDLYARALTRAGLPHTLANAATHPFYDDLVRASHAEGLALSGEDVGCPLLHLPGPDGQPVAFFGPVVTPYPRGDAAGRLWDAVSTAAATEGFFELKRSRTRPPDVT